MLGTVTTGAPRTRAAKLLQDSVLELGMVEDADITSRYLMREFQAEEVARLKGVVDRITRALRNAR